MAYRGSPGINKLACVLKNQMKLESFRPPSLDFGTIGADFSLLTDTFPLNIPKGDYAVCRCLHMGTVNDCFAVIDTPHFHEVPVPEGIRSLQPGDRVLVAWVRNEPVVVDILV